MRLLGRSEQRRGTDQPMWMKVKGEEQASWVVAKSEEEERGKVQR